MNFEEILTLAAQGKKIDNDTWRKLSKEQKQQVSQARKKGATDNDWSWYATSEEIAKSMGSIPYNIIPGVGFKEGLKTYLSGPPASIGIKNITQKEMSVMTIYYINSIGRATQRTDGVNMAATKLYTAIRSKNSGAANYEAADLMMYILAMREVYSEVAELRRIIGLAKVYDKKNHNLPYLLLRAVGLSDAGIADLVANLSDYRGKLNVLISKVNAFAVPNYFKAFNRSDLLASNVICDSTSPKGQLYVYVKQGYYNYSAIASEAGSSLQFSEQQATNFGLRLSVLENMLDNLYLDEDINIMSGDIEKKFEGSLYAVQEVSEDYTVQAVFNENLLNQIENTVFVPYGEIRPSGLLAGNLDIQQSNQLIQFAPRATFSNSKAYISHYYLNSHKDSPDYKDNIDWTRNYTVYDYDGIVSATQSFVDILFGLEIFCGIQMWRSTDSSSTEVSTLVASVVSVASESAMINAFALSQFDWHPAQYFAMYGTDRMEVLMDLKNFTVVNTQTINNLHLMACSAAFWMPEK